MQPIVEPRARSGFGHRLALTAIIGASVLSVAVVVLLSIYVDRISDMATGLRRVDGLADYDGRPTPVQVAENPAVNFLIFVDSGDQLQAAVIANLSGSRRDLTLVALPADLVAGPSGQTLANAYASGPLPATQLVEQLTGARMDHQAQLELDGFGAVVDGLDGLAIADRRLTGATAASYLTEASSSPQRSQRAAELIRQTMIQAEADGGVLNLPRFDRVISALGGCLTIDSGLSNDAIEGILVESRVHLDDVGLWPVLGSRTAEGTVADPQGLAALRAGLASDALATARQLGVGGLTRSGTAVRTQATDKSVSLPASSPTATLVTSDATEAPMPAVTTGPTDESLSPSDGGEDAPSPSVTQTSR
ncbi:hypothetical protein ATK74_2713 [Propionicimonas paludicola]|uniref:Cell envelope-related transcriptional attenuator domain-containing protein n=1 Tax=Propionicimonas paludicola TaxID=185243 RepID=A0A2A9CWT3_9ACTN|nr:LCP family protein [Propionicimonas paludicola]PFG18132.1 hypothetical protein ATK74_2713 [Propionicimonas paludicola]